MTLTKTEYNTIHQWNLRHYTKTGACEHCKELVKTQWSNISGNYIKGDRSDWQELCAPCHTVYDMDARKRRRKCDYCRKRHETISDYFAPNGYYQNGNERKYRLLKLCRDCLGFEKATQLSYDNSVDIELELIETQTLALTAREREIASYVAHYTQQGSNCL